MSSKFLFLYKTPLQKSELLKCEKAINTLFRKFRKSVVFTYLQVDTSDYCLAAFKERLLEEISKNHIVFSGCTMTAMEKKLIFRETLEGYAEAHFLKGCVICCPLSEFEISGNENEIVCTHKTERNNLDKAVSLALSLSQERKKKLSVCEDQYTQEYLAMAVSSTFDKSLHIEKSYLTLDEALLTSINTIPEFDVILASSQIAQILQMHIGYTTVFGSTSSPSGYSVIYTDKGNVYTKQNFPYEQMHNTTLFSSLLAFTAIIEKEFSMKNAATWLRKAASEVFEIYKNADADDFIGKVVSEIKKPMRKHTR